MRLHPHSTQDTQMSFNYSPFLWQISISLFSWCCQVRYPPSSPSSWHSQMKCYSHDKFILTLSTTLLHALLVTLQDRVKLAFVFIEYNNCSDFQAVLLACPATPPWSCTASGTSPRWDFFPLSYEGTLLILEKRMSCSGSSKCNKLWNKIHLRTFSADG